MKNALKKQIGGRHYRSMVIQPAEFIYFNDIGFLEGNVIKYVCRYRMKNGIQDLLKAKHYVELLIEMGQKKLISSPRRKLPHRRRSR